MFYTCNFFSLRWVKFGLPLLLLSAFNCGKAAAPQQPATAKTGKTVASLVPAATDLIIGMGAADHLVAVSTYDRIRPDVQNLPKVGDYQTVDWEELHALHPDIMVIDIARDRRPAGFEERADELHTKLDDITIDRLEQVFGAIDKLGRDLELPDQARMAKDQLRGRLDAIHARTTGSSPVRTLLVVSDDGRSVVGPDTYLDDLLRLAGGINVVTSPNPYPQIDREMLLKLNPDVIIQLLPQASPQERQEAAGGWQQTPQLSAVAAGRVYTIDNWYALLPGWHVADLAEQFEQCLYPTKPSSSPSLSGRGQPATGQGMATKPAIGP